MYIYKQTYTHQLNRKINVSKHKYIHKLWIYIAIVLYKHAKLHLYKL